MFKRSAFRPDPDTIPTVMLHYERRPRLAEFLRARAGRLRGIAGTARTAISDPLRVLADEMEARAEQLEKADTPSDDNGEDRRAARTSRQGAERIILSRGLDSDRRRICRRRR